MKTLMLFRGHWLYVCSQQEFTIMLETVSTLIWFCGRHQACLKRMSVKLTKGNVSHWTFSSLKTKPYCCWFTQTSRSTASSQTCLMPKATRICWHTPHSHINQPFICFLHSARSAFCLSVTASLGKTHACQSQTGWHINWIYHINIWVLSGKLSENWVNYKTIKQWMMNYQNFFCSLLIILYSNVG